ncbi:bifunctional phosphopantothenoylcysteine decarboxylase/phosphopantothenate--cysteine ligase CoaBC [Lewinellaceae bacterium SD302]|nr:bifunctional phosphopantothenoylcysteine decarboxylase/phosphopantothenate--cysteine ligase CoaBC [Lewinellaceae bacterium SD302]
MTLRNKKIILAITGSIAAYKAALIVRGLIKAGAEVQVIMTAAATDFISPLTLSTLSKRPVYSSARGEDDWNNHVELGLWADAMLIAPITANTLAKLANGHCEDMVGAVYLSARCPVWFAPAMDLDMWAHPATQANVAKLQSYGNHLIDVADGELASGLSGAGRLAEPEEIIAVLESHFGHETDLAGKKVLVTAGPTYEALDPVRFIGNHSSGTMGVEVAMAAARRGAEVELVLGPSRLKPVHPKLNVTHVISAREMYAVCTNRWPATDIAVMAAAVADYRPATVAEEKIKKKGGADESFSLELVRNPDIAATLGADKRKGQLLIGFAMETENGPANARRKLVDKNLDAIVLNSIREEGAGFGEGTNKVAIITADRERKYSVKPKTAVAKDILDVVVELQA